MSITNILLVEDDTVDVMNVQRSFKKANIKNPLYIANNGVEALSVLRNETDVKMPKSRRLVLLDLNMPKMGDRKSTRLNSSHPSRSRMPSSA